MKVLGCSCVSVGKEFRSKKKGDRPFVFSYWSVQDPDFSDGCYFRSFTWTDTGSRPKKGDKGLCVKVNGDYGLIEE